MRRATALTMDRVAGWAISRLFAWIHGRTSRTCPNSYRLLAYSIAVLSMVAAVGRWVVRLSPCVLSMADGRVLLKAFMMSCFVTELVMCY